MRRKSRIILTDYKEIAAFFADITKLIYKGRDLFGVQWNLNFVNSARCIGLIEK